jgi:phage anti-repressor protein
MCCIYVWEIWKKQIVVCWCAVSISEKFEKNLKKIQDYKVTLDSTKIINIIAREINN